MTVYVQTGIGSCLHIVFYGGEVHVAIAVYTTGHLHGVSGYGLGEVLVYQVLKHRLVQIVVYGSTCTQLEVGVLLVVDIILQSLVLIQVTIVVVVRFTLFKFLFGLCHRRSHQAGGKHAH